MLEYRKTHGYLWIWRSMFVTFWILSNMFFFWKNTNICASKHWRLHYTFCDQIRKETLTNLSVRTTNPNSSFSVNERKWVQTSIFLEDAVPCSPRRRGRRSGTLRPCPRRRGTLCSAWWGTALRPAPWDRGGSLSTARGTPAPAWWNLTEREGERSTVGPSTVMPPITHTLHLPTLSTGQASLSDWPDEPRKGEIVCRVGAARHRAVVVSQSLRDCVMVTSHGVEIIGTEDIHCSSIFRYINGIIRVCANATHIY